MIETSHLRNNLTQELLTQSHELLKTFEAHHQQTQKLIVTSKNVNEAPKAQPVHDIIETESKNDNKQQTIKHFPELFVSFSHNISVSSLKSNDLILGMAQNIDPLNYIIFCASLREVSNSIEVFMFINSNYYLLNEIQSISLKYSIYLIIYDLNTLKPSYLLNYHPSSLRWIFFYQLLTNFDTNFDINFITKFHKVLVIDVRDSVFQSNPFDLFLSNKNTFYMFQEMGSQTIGSCGWNSGWIRDCFPGNILNSVQSNAISCSGVSLGTMDIMLQYIEIITTILLGKHSITDRFPQCERNGVDQGIHNVIVGLGLLPLIDSKSFIQQNMKILGSSSSSSKTYDGSIVYQPNKGTSKELLTNGIFLLKESEYPLINLQNSQITYQINQPIKINTNLVTIIHQYDRKIDIQTYFAQKFIKSIDFNNLFQTINTNLMCNNYKSIENIDLFKGMYDIGSINVISPTSCCNLCNNYGLTGIGKAAKDKSINCNAFTYLNGKCFFKQCPTNILQHISRHSNGGSKYNNEILISSYRV